MKYKILITLIFAFLISACNQSIEPVDPFIVESVAGENDFPTLVDFWDGMADFVVDVEDTGLPMGESETFVMTDGDYWSYVHASDQSAGIIDQCGDPVAFPGCTVIYESVDAGISFAPPDNLTCQFECQQCPCDSFIDHIDQQQYPSIAPYDGGLLLVHEYRGRTILRRSPDGLTWSIPEQVSYTGHWRTDYAPCRAEERIGQHPFVPYDYECLAGAPPAIYVEGDTAYVFTGLGQNPGRMGCFKGNVNDNADKWDRCDNNPLFVGADDYGPIEERGEATNEFFDFRTVSSADVLKIGEQYYMVYEGVRGPGPFDAGDTQFALGLARSTTNEIDGAWEKYAGNPILVDLPGNVGLGHADLLVVEGETFLYTSLDGVKRSRLRLEWVE